MSADLRLIVPQRGSTHSEFYISWLQQTKTTQKITMILHSKAKIFVYIYVLFFIVSTNLIKI